MTTLIQNARVVEARLRETTHEAFNKRWELHLRGAETIAALVTALEAAELERDALRQRMGNVFAALESAEKDAARLVFAMSNCNTLLFANKFAIHVIRVGGTGDIHDCRNYIDTVMEAAK
jgi:aspartate aminotransferase-like enzyme